MLRCIAVLSDISEFESYQPSQPVPVFVQVSCSGAKRAGIRAICDVPCGLRVSNVRTEVRISGSISVGKFGISFSEDAALGLSLAELLGALEGPIGLRDLLADRQNVQSESN